MGPMPFWLFFALLMVIQFVFGWRRFEHELAVDGAARRTSPGRPRRCSASPRRWAARSLGTFIGQQFNGTLDAQRRSAMW